MRRYLLLAAVALSGALAAPGIAAAQSIAYAVPYGTTNMRAGPGLEYQVIAIIRGGSAVTVYGCVRDFSWCDSSVQNIRGWVSTTRLQFQYGGNLVPFQGYYSYFNAPIIQFDFGYWDRYYQDEPWYRRHHRRHRDHRNDNNDVGIFPEEGGGRHPRDQGPPPDLYDQGSEILPDDGGGGRYERRRSGSPDQGGAGVFPEEGGGNAAPRHRNSGGSGGNDSGGAVCPVDSPNCQ
jgi:uncharacterized protein YraI